TVCLVQVFAESSAQKLTIHRKNTELRQIFSDIHSQTGYSVVYSVHHVKAIPPLSVSMSNVELKDAMAQLLADLPLDFVITGKEIVIKTKPITPRTDRHATNTAPRSQQQSVTGRIVDEQGTPLQGAAVRVKGTAQVTSTDADGRFTLVEVDDAAMLVISFIGYATLELPASSELTNIAMNPEVSGLDEVVVMGYGTQRKGDITGAVSSIRAEDFNKGTNATFDQLIGGKAAGVQFVQNSGEPGGGVAVRIRGASSVNAGTSPLYV